MTETRYCQSCGMPLGNPEDFGTNQDGGQSQEYCGYCYRQGKFVQDCTMDEMVDFCFQYEKQEGRAPADEDTAKKEMRAWFATLKRWKKDGM